MLWFERLETVPVNVPLISVVVSEFTVIALIIPPSILSPLIWLSASVSVPPDISILPLLIVGEVKILFVNVSVVSLPTRVSVDVGSVSVPVLEIVDIVGVATNSNLTFWLPSVLSNESFIFDPATNLKSSWPVGEIDVVVPIWPPSETA